MPNKTHYVCREATVADIDAMHVVRMAVKENVLSNPTRVTHEMYDAYLTTDGKGWVCEVENNVVGFSVLNLNNNSVWALFVHPEFEGRGIAQCVFSSLVAFAQESGIATLTLTTAPGTRAARFYCAQGWQEKGLTQDGEMRFVWCAPHLLRCE